MKYAVVAKTESCLEDLKSKYFQWEKRDLQSKMRTYFRSFEDFMS